MSTVTQPLAVPRSGASAVARDFSELIKVRVTSLIVMSAWCGFYFGAAKTGISSVSFTLLHALLGIGMVSGGTAAMNEVIERDSDALMRRTQRRPLVTQSMSVSLATATALFLIFGGAGYLALATNVLTAALSLATAAVYLLAYTPLKKVSPICTFVGAFPGAMPAVLGWTAVRGGLDWEAFVLFAIMFFWQFPHFHSIALLYREDYERAGIRMLPVVERDGRSTARAILLYGAALLPTTLMPTLLGMSGILYLIGASLLGLGLFYYCVRIWKQCLPVSSGESKMLARGLLKATVFYLPLLFALMMINSAA
ncbi:MAG TPA: heme o synthase [Candidatus Acidoferrales bacterium]|nr:heme o synthase [Candidatus Acidoferrales bacterium]